VIPPRKKGLFVLHEGHKKLGVLRPLREDHRKAAIDEAKRIAAANASGEIDQAEAQRLFQAILANPEVERVYLGAAGQSDRSSSARAVIIDPKTLEIVGDIEPGDSFVALEDINTANFQPRERIES
jgi:hypothetical protein